MKRFVRPVVTLVITLFVTAFLLSLFSFSAGGAPASAAQHRPRPTPTPSPTPPSSKGVNSQAIITLNPGDTFCLPIQQVAGIQGGKVEGGGFSYKDTGGYIATRWNAYNGPTASTLQVVNTATSFRVVMVNTVPIGSFYQVCNTNITNVIVDVGIQQSEFTNDTSFP